MLASKNSATRWSGLPRKSPRGCLPRLKRGYWQWRQGVPVFRLVRTAFDIEGRAVEVCDTIMSADAYVLNYELPAH